MKAGPRREESMLCHVEATFQLLPGRLNLVQRQPCLFYLTPKFY
jgi:hypothetical protein